MHSHTIMHRNINLENVLVELNKNDSILKLTSFNKACKYVPDEKIASKIISSAG